MADYLVARGFLIVARNMRLGALELDIVAKRGPLVAIVEVRTRGASSWEGPLASIGARKRMLLLRATERLWRGKLKAMRDVQRVRIDVAAVEFDQDGQRVEYFEGAIVGS